MMRNEKVYTALALAGTLPFIASALLLLVGTDSLPMVGLVDKVVASYGLAIVCFLAGAHWGMNLAGRSFDSLNLFVISNVIFLAAWFAYIGASVKVAIVVQVIAFLALLYVDKRLAAGDVIAAGYFRLRTVATAIAIVSLIVVIVVGP